IILIHAAYDIPGMATDGSEMFDASDRVYEFLLCSICPVNLAKPGLSYNAATDAIEERVRDWIVDGPAKGFLFPAFNDRDTDIHQVLYYSKKAEDLMPEFIEALFGSATTPISAGSQKEIFNTLIADTLGEDCSYEVMRNIHDTINEMLEEAKESLEPLTLTPKEIKRVFERSGVSDEKLEEMDGHFEELADEKAVFMATNLPGAKKFEIATPDVIIKVNPERSDLIETRLVDGRPCLVIAVDDHIEVNGLPVRTLLPPLTEETDM
ncbi:MAG: DUF4317 domain-containing protein, partial [Lachnospiraceae bacterium]|nr:DUF4317 domain-containing protein [Lachnospiraceae bacterium]